MIKKILTAALLMVAGAICNAQEHQAAYERQVRMVGPAGVGVETIIDRWEKAEPDNPAVHSARFAFLLAKSRSSRVVPMDKPKYLGNAPVMSLKDSAGRDVHYYEVDFFDDEMFTLCLKAIDRAVGLAPSDLRHRADKIGALVLYEKECPDLARDEIISLINYNAAKKPVWTAGGKEVADGTLESLVQDYCYTFFRYGTPGGYDAFKVISERMLKLHPKDTGYMNNLGSYYLVYKDEPKKAVRWYDKVLRIKPDDYTAAHNCVLAARRIKNTRLEVKYLPYLINATSDGIERQGYEVRLDALRQK